MTGFTKKDTLAQFQELMRKTYSVPDDRFFSLWDLIANHERFAMRALKGIRKDEKERITKNLCIAFSWMMTISNRLHIDVAKATWSRFPGICSYCKSAPCACKEIKSIRKGGSRGGSAKKPKKISEFQNMFSLIYPASGRTLSEAGIHLAEEIGELSEAVLGFLGEHKPKQFEGIEIEIADYVSCVFGVANSARIDIAAELARMFRKGCQVCHRAPCECNFSFVGRYKS